MFERLNKNKNDKGFTLVELLVVIAIIGILAVVAVPSLMKNITKAKAAKIVADFSSIKSAAMAEYADGELEIGDTIEKLDVEDLSLKPANYTLTYEKDNEANKNITAVKLTIDTDDAKVAARVKEELPDGVIGEGNDNDKITLDIIGGSAESDDTSK